MFVSKNINISILLAASLSSLKRQSNLEVYQEAVKLILILKKTYR